MPLTDYTSFQEVRAALGVEDDELSDDTLSLPMYETKLGISLDQIDSTLQAAFLVIAAKVATTRTTPETLVFDRTRLFATYAVAIACIPSIGLRAMKGESDEKADYSRFSGTNLQDLANGLAADFEGISLGLQKAYAAFNASTVTKVVRVFIAGSSPSSDPVTG